MRALLLSSLFFTIMPCSATVILLHGSFAVDSAWYQPGGTFYNRVQKYAKQHKRTVSAFSWSGKFTPRAIIEDAADLVAYLLTLPPEENITIAAHSNGGNVSAYATILLAELAQSIILSQDGEPETRSLHFPQRLYTPFIEKCEKTKMHSNHAVIDPAVYQQITDTYTRLYQTYKTRSPELLRRKKYFIQELFLMGTPIQANTFLPDMSIVEHVYNLYSKGDPIQAIAGDRHLPHHERSGNFHVHLHQVVEHCYDCVGEAEENGTPVNPCHECIHAPLIGQWLLALPEMLKFKNAHTQQSVLRDGTIWLDETAQPVYQPDSYFDQGVLEVALLQNDQDQSSSSAASQDQTNEQN